MARDFAEAYSTPESDRRYFAAIGFAAAALIALVIVPFFLNHDLREYYLSEGGPIQVFSAAFYLIIVVVLFREAGMQFVAEHFYFALLPLAMCLRELDFHTHFTSMSMTRLSFYLSGQVPMAEKLFAVVALAVLGLATLLMLRRHTGSFLAGLRRFDAAPVALALAVASAVVSKTLDGAARKLEPFGIEIGASVNFLLLVLEEVLELGIPIFMAIAVFAYLSRAVRRIGAE